MKVLITGSNGQLGYQIIKNAPEKINGDLVQILNPSRTELNLESREECEEYIYKIKPDWIINTAAYTDVDKAETDQEKAFAINFQAPKTFAKVLKKTGGKILHLSTDYVFDGEQSYPYSPSQTINPLNVYGASKFMGEKSIIDLLGETNQCFILRTSWLIGPYRKNFALTMLRLHNEKDELRVIYDRTGSPTSTLSLANVCWRIILSQCMQENIMPKIMHWTDSGIASWFDIAMAVGEIGYQLGLIKEKAIVHPVSASIYPSNAVRPNFSVLDSSETLKLLNIRQPYWRDSLYQILLAIKKNIY